MYFEIYEKCTTPKHELNIGVLRKRDIFVVGTYAECVPGHYLKRLKLW